MQLGDEAYSRCVNHHLPNKVYALTHIEDDYTRTNTWNSWGTLREAGYIQLARRLGFICSCVCAKRVPPLLVAASWITQESCESTSSPAARISFGICSHASMQLNEFGNAHLLGFITKAGHIHLILKEVRVWPGGLRKLRYA